MPRTQYNVQDYTLSLDPFHLINPTGRMTADNNNNNNSVSSSDDDDYSDWDDVDPVVRQQAVYIMDKRITTTVTSEAEHAHNWIDDIEIANRANHLRLIVGFDIKLGTPEPRPRRHPIALLILCVRRSCLVYEIDYADLIPNSLLRFLADRKNNTFVGVDIPSKVVKLDREYGLGYGGRYVDLGVLAADRYNRPELRTSEVGELRTFLHGEDVVRPWPRVVDNWDDADLSYEHVRTACIDAYTCYELGSYLVYPIRRTVDS